ncbi:MAG TPA: hypothetical protein VKF84_07685 [Candidatus Sulfotelmatobacter sp.]|nr:hypothetical protein [Candidatus Sulfotelmatobacter sp.]
MKSLTISPFRGAAFAIAAIVFFCTVGWAQEPPASAASPAPGEAASAVRDLQDQVRQLRGLVEEMRAENAESRAEMHQLRHDLEATRALLERPASPASADSETAASLPQNGSVIASDSASAAASATAASIQASAPLEERVQKLEESTSLIGSKIDEQYQTKVETASKYRARLHGIVLMNAFRNVGGSDNLDLPNYSQPVAAGSPQASLGATLRQSEIGLEVFGPNIAGARTSADVQLDFAGGFPATGNGVSFGIARLQTANVRFDWEHTSIVAGQDALFISPLSPTSFASLATPAFAFAGNLWGWTPQVRVEHRFSISDQQTVTVQAGVLDNLDWEPPYNSFYRSAQAGELSGQPAYAFRTAWSRPVREHPLSFGVAGYYGRQDWAWSRFVDAWSGMADWQVPILPRLALSGEFYRGRGIGGLGGAIGTSILYGGPPGPYTPIRGLNTAGGWAQLKLQLTPKLELNGVIAEDNAFAGDVRGFATDQYNGGEILGRNRGALGNVVFRPRSDLLLSAEFRRLHTFPIYDSSSITNQVNLSVGILF